MGNYMKQQCHIKKAIGKAENFMLMMYFCIQQSQRQMIATSYKPTRTMGNGLEQWARSGTLYLSLPNASFLEAPTKRTPSTNINEHIREITTKSNNVKGFLQRNLKSCPVNIKNKAICTRSILDYTSIIW